MVVDGKKETNEQLNHMDRLSDLPDSILHCIISYLGTEEACRTTILSKKWAHIWSTGLILDFKPQYFVPRIDGDFVGSSNRPYSDETVERFMSFIESTMRRYSEKNPSVWKFGLEYPIIDPEMAGRIDRWVGIALRNQVEELSLSVIPDDPPSYALPTILFSAKSLMSMKLHSVRLPYIKDANLISLQSLDLTEVEVDEQMLQDIIMSCPLKILKLDSCSGLSNISIPCCSRLEALYAKHTVPVGGTILVDTLSFHRFTFFGNCGSYKFSHKFTLTSASRKNLRELRIFDAFIDDDIFSELVSELPSIENITLTNCRVDEDLIIASQTLKELRMHDCDDLHSVTMEAPELDTFCYNGNLEISSVTNSHKNYNAYFHLTATDLETGAFYCMKEFLNNSDCCKVLSISLSYDFEINEIEFDKGELSNFIIRPPFDAIDIQELKVSVSCAHCILGESSCRALIDGLLWCCHPAILSLAINLPCDNSVIKTFLEILQKKVNHWKHPLKRMEIEGANCPSLLFSWDVEIRLRLYW